jgi:hypothetical protein
MTIILTGETGATTRWARGWKTHRNRDCNGCRPGDAASQGKG